MSMNQTAKQIFKTARFGHHTTKIHSLRFGFGLDLLCMLETTGCV